MNVPSNKISDLINDLPSYSNDVIKSKLRDLCSEFANNNCVHPKEIIIKDKLTGVSRTILVPCGKCWHCRCMHQAEWVSRMSLHTRYCAKYAYFVTLTYKSYKLRSNIPLVLRDAYYREDSYNEFHRNCYSPCLIRHEHVVRFMKYLRKFHGSDYISFFSGSEYGSTYGRPHHHLILWSNEPISYNDVCAAWSCRLPSYHGKRRSSQIGRVDFHDLNSNGTIVCEGKNFGRDAHKCFTYVSKYLSKNFVDPNDFIDKKSRLNYFISDYSKGLICYEDLKSIFSPRLKKMMSLFSDWAEYFADYVREKEYQELCEFDPFAKYNKYVFYDYETSSSSYQIYRSELSEAFDEKVAEWYRQIPSCIFRKIFKPYCNYSRSPGIASEYLRRHIADYSSGKFNLPTFNGKTLVLPSYFVRKTKEYLIRYYATNSRLISKCNSLDILINKDTFNARFPSSGDLRFDIPYYFDPSYVCKYLSSHIVNHTILPDVDLGIGLNIQNLLRSEYSFRDVCNNTRCLVFIDSSGYLSLRHYTYNRSSRLYDYKFTQSFSSFLDNINKSLQSYFPFYSNSLNNSNDIVISYRKFIEDLDLLVNTFYGLDYDSGVSFIIDVQNEIKTSFFDRAKRDNIYKINSKL